VDDLRRALLDLAEAVATTTTFSDMHPLAEPLKQALRVLRNTKAS
jgi:hypothetical protein